MTLCLITLVGRSNCDSGGGRLGFLLLLGLEKGVCLDKKAKSSVFCRTIPAVGRYVLVPSTMREEGCETHYHNLPKIGQ